MVLFGLAWFSSKSSTRRSPGENWAALRKNLAWADGSAAVAKWYAPHRRPACFDASTGRICRVAEPGSLGSLVDYALHSASFSLGQVNIRIVVGKIDYYIASSHGYSLSEPGVR